MQKCCIIVPCYNEGDRILEEEFVSFVNEYPTFTILFVNDGSSDHTLAKIEQLAKKTTRIKISSLEQNSGKAAAVRFGVLEALKDEGFTYFAFLDADLAIPFSEFLRLYHITLINKELMFTFLSKIRRADAEVKQSYKRFLMGRILSLFARFSLKLPVYDTQCGCKLMNREIAELVFSKPFISAWLFDIEIFWRILNQKNQLYFKTNTLEVPLNKLMDRGSSKVSGKAIFKLPFEFIKIHRTYSK